MSNWLRPGAASCPGRLFCHVCGRGQGQAQMIPGWPYSVIAALEPGRPSWTAVLDGVRPGPEDDQAEGTAAQFREVVTRLIEAGHWRDGDRRILVVLDAAYDVTRLACLLADLPAELPGRLRPDRVMQLPAPPRPPATMRRPPGTAGPARTAHPGRPARVKEPLPTAAAIRGLGDPHAYRQSDGGYRRGQGELGRLGRPIAASMVWQILHDAGMGARVRPGRSSGLHRPAASSQPISFTWTRSCSGAPAP